MRRSNDKVRTEGDKTMRNAKRLFVSLALAVQAALVAAEDKPADASGWPAVDKSDWKCKYCAFQTGWSGEFELGAAYVSDDSYKFGEYTGLEKGGYAVANANARYTNPESANRWDLYATNLGFPYRAVDVDGGKQGSYKLRLNYSELPHYISDSARTPFIGSGGDSLTLPGGWVPSGTTSGMTALAGSLQDVDIENTRKRVGVGLTVPWRDWEAGVNVRHETREGTKRIAGAFLTTSAQMVAPVDYTTDDIEAAVSYAGAKSQVKLAYHFSTFRNGNESLTWINPFDPLLNGVAGGEGRLALPPDNQFHQLLASGAYQFTQKTRGTANIAVGRMEQDENFLATTQNGPLLQPLPRSSLQGSVETITADVKLMSLVTDKLRIDAAYKYDDRNNKTPQDTFSWVSTDSAVAMPRTNLPYSFTRNLFKLAADYRMAHRDKIAVGYDYDIYDRTYQEVAKTKESTAWVKYIARAQDGGDVSFKFAHSDRNGSTYDPLASPTLQNPLMRKYNMADRARDALGLRVTQLMGGTVTVGLDFSYAADDYSNSTVGLTSSDDMSIGGDLAVPLAKNTTFHVFANYEEINSEQAGASSLVSPPDWSATNNDVIGTVGIGLKQKALAGKLDFGADYTMSRSRGKTAVTGGPGFPDLTSQLGSFKLYGSYQFTKAMSVAATYWYESYRSQDWQLDGVTPSTIPNVLSLGETSPNYNVNFVSLSLRYRF